MSVALASLLLAACGASSEGTPPEKPAKPQHADARPAAVGTMTVDVDVKRGRPTPDGKAPTKVALDLRFGSPAKVDPPPLEAISIAFPHGTSFDGTALPACQLATLERSGVAACPKAAIAGSGTAIALADTTHTEATLTLVNGGPGSVLVHTAMDSPARVRAATRGAVAHAADAPRLTATIPRGLQEVAGVPLVVRRIRLDAGSGGWLSTANCPPSGHWTISATATFADRSQKKRRTEVPCK